MGYGARPVGAGLGALIAELYGVEACILAAVALFALQALLIVLSPVVRLKTAAGHGRRSALLAVLDEARSAPPDASGSS